MRRLLICLTLFCILAGSCKTKPRSFAEQLKSNFLTHLNKADSSLVLDSFSILRVDTANQRLFSFFEDTLYKLSLGKVQLQMINATIANKKDSMLFYQGELDYMVTRRDSLTEAISKADTVKKYGLLASCFVQIGKNEKRAQSPVYYFLDLNMTVMNPDRIDTTISQLSARLK